MHRLPTRQVPAGQRPALDELHELPRGTDFVARLGLADGLLHDVLRWALCLRRTRVHLTFCPAGRYQSEEGYSGATCPPCPAGNKGTSSRATCELCASGKYSNTTGAVFCTGCEAGRYGLRSREDCDYCQEGRYHPDTHGTGAHVCITCPAGKYDSADRT